MISRQAADDRTPMQKNESTTDASITRRSFLERLFTGAVVAAAAPTVLRSNVVPEITVDATSISGTYTILLEDIPPIQPVGGSIRLVIREVSPTFRIIVTRVSEEAFEAVNAQCPHEDNKIRSRRNGEDFLQCEAHDSKFAFDGTYIEGPADGQNLKRYQTRFDGDQTLEIEIDELLSVGTNGTTSSSIALHSSGPMPGSVTFFVESTRADRIALTIWSIDGAEVARPFDGQIPSGRTPIAADLSHLPSGLYLYRCVGTDGVIGSGKLVV